MHKPISVLVLSALVLTSCGTIRESRVNPFNWFGASSSTQTTVRAETEGFNPLIPPQRRSIFRASKDADYAGSAVDQVTELHIDRRPGGAVIRAVGVTRYQGPYAVKLVKQDDESDATTLTYTLMAEQYRAETGTAGSRSITAAVWMTDNDMAGIRTIRVKGRNNTRTVNR